MEKIFKVLVWGKDTFVNEALLDKGVYMTSIPSLHPEETTIESYIETLKSHSEKLSLLFDVDSIVGNIKGCEFVNYKLEEVK